MAGPGVLLFKHSTRCPISARAYRELELFAAESPVPILLIWVVEDRPLSNRVAEVLGVPHASPQAIYVRAGEVVWTDSHHRITAEGLREVVESPMEAEGSAPRPADTGGGRPGKESRSGA
ncbi:MAG: hypothetical protein Kow00109_03920 [Acidobacteriota bacterium]